MSAIPSGFRPREAALLLGAAAVVAACGGDPTPPAASVDAAAVDTVSAAETGEVACSVDSQCPKSDNPCAQPRCDVVDGCIVESLADGTTCDDGDACTADDVCAAGVCAGAASCECLADAQCAALEDGDLCNGTLYCDLTTHTCVVLPATVVACATDGLGPCETSTCAPATGACAPAPANEGDACDDGDLCSVGTACVGGVCTGGKSDCTCTDLADCAALEDGNLCNGTLYCDKTALPWTCEVNEATVVACPGKVAGSCVQSACAPQDGGCVDVAVADGEACDIDGFVCTADVCAAGICQPGAAIDCSCTADADCLVFEDGDACNGTLFCNKASQVCQPNPASVVVCPVAGAACAPVGCDPADGWCKATASADGAPCSDGLACTTGDACKGGVCAPSETACQCASQADCDAFDDDDLCNGTLYCDLGTGTCKPNPATAVVCPVAADGPCAHSVCQPQTGACALMPTNEGLACEADGSVCTSVDVCKDGVCTQAPSGCPCDQDGDCAAFEDGNPCTGSLYCDAASGACLVNPATVVGCAADTDLADCVEPRCDPADGICKPTSRDEGSGCDVDDFVCTADACAAGTCLAGANACLCWEDAACAPFEDGDACNGSLYCDKAAEPKVCKINPASFINCPGDPAGCQVASCKPEDGSCVVAAAADGGSCDDADACTIGETCAGGVCLGGAATVCDDDNPCTDDACVPASGCTTTDNDESCDDEDACSMADSCSDGVCAGVLLDCDDANVCTIDACDIGGSCSHGDAAPSTPCPAGHCAGGACVADGGCLKAADCNDGDLCTVDACVDEACSYAPACDDANPCTTDDCAFGTGNCTHAPADGDCEDGDPCTWDDLCEASTCVAGKAALINKTLILTNEADATYSMMRFEAIDAAPDGGWVVAGWGQLTGTDAVAARVDSAGKLVWQASVHVDEDTWFYDVAATSDGGAVASGHVGKNGNITTDQGLIVRFNASGEVVWQNLVGDPDKSDRFWGVTASADGGFAAAGQRPENSAADYRFWLVRWSADGNQLSESLFKGSGMGVSHAVAADPGGYAAVGWVWTYGLQDAYLIRYDGAGEVVFDRSLPGKEYDLFYAVTAMAGGGWTAAGHTESLGAGGKDGRVVRFDATGNVLWQRILGDSGFNVLYDVAAGPDGSVWVVGSNAKTFPPGDGQIVALDPWGNTLWSRLYDSGKGDELLGVTRLGDGRLGMAGFVQNNLAKPIGLILVTDPFGESDCQKVGLCVGKGAGGCDDSDPCTADACDAATGCSHTPQADGDACGPHATCLAGACAERFAATTLLSGQRSGLINAATGVAGQIWKPCYRRSVDGASTAAFHQGCDQSGDAVVVIRTSSGRTFGAWNPVGWKSSGGPLESAEAFLFSVDGHTFHPVTDPSKAINDSAGVGPSFGEGPDLHVFADMTKPKASIGKSYACAGNYNAGLCYQWLTAGAVGEVITEIEVFVR